ncbi:MAG: hypothetical protein OEM81_08680 [Acidimicrobiia bacterium]|nr:hypothetical protein [Acidimicrobiia bacterium]MDH3397888.1 hypothetical protein [Acidimicrobiia bacterium]
MFDGEWADGAGVFGVALGFGAASVVFLRNARLIPTRRQRTAWQLIGSGLGSGSIGVFGDRRLASTSSGIDSNEDLTASTPGSGIGLAMVKMIAQAYDGSHSHRRSERPAVRASRLNSPAGSSVRC